MTSLIDWLGSGEKPVAQALADARAKICEACPENRPIRWWEAAIETVAVVIRKWFEFKHDMGLTVPNEEKLGMCRACGCCNILKVWVPIDHALGNHRREDFPENCWIRKWQ